MELLRACIEECKRNDEDAFYCRPSGDGDEPWREEEEYLCPYYTVPHCTHNVLNADVSLLFDVRRGVNLGGRGTRPPEFGEIV